MIIIHHDKDLDGYSSGAICKKKYPNAKLIGYDYNQPIPWDQIPEGEPVIMIDVSLPMPDMYEMAKKSNWQMTWIDHHISAINDYKAFVKTIANSSAPDYTEQNFLTPVLEVGIAACEIAWRYLFTNLAMPFSIEMLGKYDTWRNHNQDEWENDILPFQYGMRQICNSAESFSLSLLENAMPQERENRILNCGKTILAYQKQINETACRKAFPATFKGLRAICLNGGGFNSQVFDSVWDEEKYDVMMPFQFDGKKWTFSIYTTKDIDCSVYAKSLGGGGHAKACGFTVSSIEEVLIIE